MEANDYSQYGEYYIDCWLEPPSVDAIIAATGVSKETAEHIIRIGDREKDEDFWYYLSVYNK